MTEMVKARLNGKWDIILILAVSARGLIAGEVTL